MPNPLGFVLKTGLEAIYFPENSRQYGEESRQGVDSQK